jgi:hypothetical protein
MLELVCAGREPVFQVRLVYGSVQAPVGTLRENHLWNPTMNLSYSLCSSHRASGISV